MVPGWIGTSLVRTLRRRFIGQPIAGRGASGGQNVKAASWESPLSKTSERRSPGEAGESPASYR
jgi:hypothetical protein